MQQQPQQMCKLVYVVGKKQVETIMSNMPRSLCNWKRKQLRLARTHTLGKLSVTTM